MTMKKILAVVVGTVIPILGFLLASRRDVVIAGAFMQFELSTRPWLYGGFVVLVAGTYLALVRTAQARLGTRAVRWELRRFRSTRWPVVAMVAVAIGWVGARYLGIRYRYFAEIHHQIRAIDALEAGALPDVWALCEDYLWIYPQRAESGAIPDPVCLPLLEGRDRLIALRDYIASVRPVSERIDGVLLPADTVARNATVRALEGWIARTGL
jgi:hypothetical protein